MLFATTPTPLQNVLGRAVVLAPADDLSLLENPLKLQNVAEVGARQE